VCVCVYQNHCFTEICIDFCCTVHIKVMSEFRGVKAHVYQVMNVSMETTYLRYGSLSPQNFQSLMNSESKLMRETDEQQASYQEFLIQIGFSEGRCHSISILLCYPSFKHLHCKRGRYSYKPESKEKADSIILFLNSHMKNLCKAILNSLKSTLCRNSVFVKQWPLESVWSTCI